MNDQRTEERFQKDTASHKMTVLRNDGVYRHLQFAKTGTRCMSFDLITWPGYLCYTGDMGTYVFTRTCDMLEFFRKKRRADGRFSIDHSYWAEKCEGQAKADGLREFDNDAFKREISKQRRKLFVRYGHEMDDVQRRDFWDELEEVKDSGNEGEHATYPAVRDWSFRRSIPGQIRKDSVFLDTDDFPDCKKYTFRFLWCCQALAWGIEQFDLATAPKEAA